MSYFGDERADETLCTRGATARKHYLRHDDARQTFTSLATYMSYHYMRASSPMTGRFKEGAY